MKLRYGPIVLVFCLVSGAFAVEDANMGKEYLKQIVSWLPGRSGGAVSRLDASWPEWLKRTGEMPPDFDKLPSIPFLPDPLILDEGGKNIPITTNEQWQEKRKWIAEQAKHWLTGTFPPGPNNLEANIISEIKDGDVTIRTVELRFGPERKAKMTVELLIPPFDSAQGRPGNGPFPVFMTQWTHRGWALIAVRRGYIGCIYAGADEKDDTEQYGDIWYPEYDFTRLMRRAWGAMRAVDFLWTLPIVDKEKIALTGHSRNGKQSLMAAAYDDRIKAVILSSGGTGAETPWRYSSEPFDNETIGEITTNFPYWFHPRLRFFFGREHKLPIEQNLLMALVAPRGLMLSSALTEDQCNPWGMEQCYQSVRRVYKFLGADENKVAVRFRWGKHGISARDIEDYIDFFDYCFGRTSQKPPNKLYYDYTFADWQKLSGEKVDINSYQPKDWKNNKADIQKQIRWLLGDEPAGVTNPGPKVFANIPATDNEYSGDYLARVIGRPKSGGSVRRMVFGMLFGADNGFGDYLEGNLYYPADANKGKLPVIIWLHEYSYPTGFGRRSEDVINKFVEKGFGVFLFDQIGFGTRIEEGVNFYRRYPHWSKMGKMVADTKAAVDMLTNLDAVDPNRIYVGGYSLGGTVALYAAALDEPASPDSGLASRGGRIAGVVSVCGVTPMRRANPDVEGIRVYSHLHGLIPRLGFFVGNENRIPIDFQEIIACVAPRPALIIAPKWDRFAGYDDVRQCVEIAREAYGPSEAGKIEFEAPDDYNRLSPKILQKVLDWCGQMD
jgi:cephalosporin-C deacetylase-like acetyl esterase